MEIQSQDTNEEASLTEQWWLDLLGNLCSQPLTKTDTDEVMLSLGQSMKSKVVQQ